MSYSEFSFEYTDEYYMLKKLYENINPLLKSNTNHEIVISPNIEFNVFHGDITKGIKWIWASTKPALNYFTKFFESINLEEKLDMFSSKFIIRGASFITLNTSEVIESDFHLDAVSQYDNSDTNILTIIFPLYPIDINMGNLEYEDAGGIKVYKYKPNNIIVWDSCKFSHRTQPYVLDEEKKRVLVSINLSTEEVWAVNTINKCLRAQGATKLT